MLAVPPHDSRVVPTIVWYNVMIFIYDFSCIHDFIHALYKFHDFLFFAGFCFLVLSLEFCFESSNLSLESTKTRLKNKTQDKCKM